MSLRFVSLALGTATALAGCAGVHERSMKSELAALSSDQPGLIASVSTASAAVESFDLSRGYPAYAAQALASHPKIRAAFSRWRSSVYSISAARRLPEPQIRFAYFARSVETRVGPQQLRIGLQQSFPWPTKLTAGADAASAAARSQQRLFESQALIVVDAVAQAYWTLWQLRQTRSIHQQHLEVLRGLSETVAARVVTGTADLADRLQIDLRQARLADRIRGLQESERRAEARLLAAVGLRTDMELPTPERPAQLFAPKLSVAALGDLAAGHPMHAAHHQAVEAELARARVAQAERLPSFVLGADWIVTGSPQNPVAAGPDAGKDALVLGAAISLPLWQGDYGDRIEAARAGARAISAEHVAAQDRAYAELRVYLADLRDAARRVTLVKGTLLPQADAVFQSVLGSYSSGRGTVAQTLLAQRDLLELKVELEEAWADHQRAWARLEQATAQTLERVEASVPNPEGL